MKKFAMEVYLKNKVFVFILYLLFVFVLVKAIVLNQENIPSKIFIIFMITIVYFLFAYVVSYKPFAKYQFEKDGFYKVNIFNIKTQYIPYYLIKYSGRYACNSCADTELHKNGKYDYIYLSNVNLNELLPKEISDLIKQRKIMLYIVKYSKENAKAFNEIVPAQLQINC